MKHTVVVGVSEDQAFHFLHELSLVVLEEPRYASATSRVRYNGERSGFTLILGHEILPDVLAVLKVIAAVGNWLSRNAIVSHCWVHDHDRLTHCLSIFDVWEHAAHV